MCTLVLARNVFGRDSILLAANRDEDPRRPSDPPALLSANPLVAGGRDRLAGGTWLAVRGRDAAIAILNRRDESGEPSPRSADRRSRGMLLLDVALAPPTPDRLEASPEQRERFAALEAISGAGLGHAALCRAFLALWSGAYAPFSLVFASRSSCWMIGQEAGQPLRADAVRYGWHAITHRDLDDRAEPRTARVLDEVSALPTGPIEPAIAAVAELLRSHWVPGGRPPVCLHRGRMVTVSSSIVWFGEGEARYLHAEGRPCERPFVDHSDLLVSPSTPSESR